MPKEVKDILIKLEANGFEAYLVGGFVRDFLMKRKTNDFDIATNAKPMDLIKIFGPSKRKIDYGCYNLRVQDYNVDITTYRRELKYEDRKPVEIEYTSNLIEDANRRDFTVNAFYMNKNEDIIDLFDGKKDLKRKRIVMIGNPNVRLKEDPLRILRAVRFASIYHFQLDRALVSAIQKEKKLLRELSVTRLKKELDTILLAGGFSLLKKLNLLNELGILNQKIVYVQDLSGLWAQLKTTVDYPQEKTSKIRQKNIEELLNCGTISMLSLYHFGYYESLIAAQILQFPLKKLEKMEKSLVIHNRKDIVMDVEEISSKSHLTGKELGALLNEIEMKIVNRELANTKQAIQRYIEER